ncbi:hypothetical protein [Mycobacteroides abscessus]|uniref:Transmembrane protein n=1 Tax=Mycobacteroides abscessus subsp. massiliense TaxID=1962118 RepID=A0A1U3LZ15_9MYCO|nr:hypothetical protein [Mycobacteroides abscessus]MBE5403973.1 hypothetical protein [Mycobacteroides abscessus]MBE5431339.1 hypothetical protein [Mycobacteroides abscessus]MBE5443858.1 hypothetical protein [Mycobacteroides abscessus]MBE5500339.1 hypothetical protein [Mycobacteroides abscessus]MBE5503448.1 hypothetical protein [Mycobacteroides abscessus]
MNVFTSGFWREFLTRLCLPNPLVRRTDRIEAAVKLCACIIAVAALALSAAIGTAIYDAGRRSYTREAQSRYPIEAVVIQPNKVPTGRFGTATLVVAQWDFKGIEHRGALYHGSAADAGDRFQIWVDDAGHSVPAPTSPVVVVSGAAAVAMALWGLFTGILGGIVSLVRRRFVRMRYEQWDSELKVLTVRDGPQRGHW